MISEIVTINELHKNGRIHKTLTLRIVTIGIVSLIFLGMLIFSFVVNGISFIGASILFVLIGFPLGFYVFSNIFKIKWDRKNKVIKVRKFDPVGILTLALYMIFRWYLGTVLGYFYHDDAVFISNVSLALLFGITLGRFISMMIIVNKIHDDLMRAKLLK